MSVKTIEDFLEWKRGDILGEATFQHGGTTYTVLLTPAARTMASGSAAYLFDEQGRFVDWTADNGDLSTVRYGFNVANGRIKNIKLEKR